MLAFSNPLPPVLREVVPLCANTGQRGGGNGGEEGGEGEVGGGEHLTPKTDGGRENSKGDLGLKGKKGTTVRSDGVGETPEEEACPMVILNPSPASSSEEGSLFPGTRPGLRGLGGSGCDGATGEGASTAMAPTG